jgi:hypothetical protein
MVYTVRQHTPPFPRHRFEPAQSLPSLQRLLCPCLQTERHPFANVRRHPQTPLLLHASRLWLDIVWAFYASIRFQRQSQLWYDEAGCCQAPQSIVHQPDGLK